MFGGFTGSAPLGDTWTWNGTGWTQLHPETEPPARWDAVMAYDPSTGDLVLFGGRGGAMGTTPLGDTWIWNGRNWANVTPKVPADSPAARFQPAFAYDPSTGQLLLFGGSNYTSLFNDTWTWTGGIWRQLSPAHGPAGRKGSLLGYDSASGQLLLFGGFGAESYNDTWTWSGSDWTQLHPTSAPPGYFGESMAYDPIDSALVLFGGESLTGSSPTFNETWSWNGTHWIENDPVQSPLPREGAGMVFDPATNQLLVTGGLHSESGPVYGDTWSYTDLTENGYWLGTKGGAVLTAGGAVPASSTAGAPVVAIAASPDREGYLSATAGGTVQASGDIVARGGLTAADRGDTTAVGIAVTADGGGYWLATANGGVFAFGDAGYFGSMARHHLNKPIVGIAAAPSGLGYYLVAADGGVFTFGDAHFEGSLASRQEPSPIIGMAISSGYGYWLAASDGAATGLGSAAHLGSATPGTVVAIAATPDGEGYLLARAEGTVEGFGDGKTYPSPAGLDSHLPVVALALS
jgi:hypothetical protein